MEFQPVEEDIFASAQLTFSFEARKLFTIMRVKQQAPFNDSQRLADVQARKD